MALLPSQTGCVLRRPSLPLRCVRGRTAAVGEAQPQLQSLRRVLDNDLLRSTVLHRMRSRAVQSMRVVSSAFSQVVNSANATVSSPLASQQKHQGCSVI